MSPGGVTDRSMFPLLVFKLTSVSDMKEMLSLFVSLSQTFGDIDMAALDCGDAIVILLEEDTFGVLVREGTLVVTAETGGELEISLLLLNPFNCCKI